MRSFVVNIESPGATVKCDEHFCERSGDIYLQIRDRNVTEYFMMCPEHAIALLDKLVRIL